MPIGIYIRSEKTKRILSEAHKGKKLSLFHRQHIGEGHKGMKVPFVPEKMYTPERNKKISESKRGKSTLWTTGKNNYLWGGKNIKYRTLHTWITKWKGKPQKCESCGKNKTTPKSIHWANKSHKYKRTLKDWISLCVFCHKKYDRQYRKYTK